MSTLVVTIESEATLRTASRRMIDAGVGSLILVGETDVPVGMITKSDILSALADDADPDEVRAEAIASTDLVEVSVYQEVKDVATVMNDAGIRHLPVIDDDELVGIVTCTDLSIYCSMGTLPRKSRGALALTE